MLSSVSRRCFLTSLRSCQFLSPATAAGNLTLQQHVPETKQYHVFQKKQIIPGSSHNISPILTTVNHQLQQKATILYKLRPRKWAPKHKEDGVSQENNIMIYVNNNNEYLFGSYLFTGIGCGIAVIGSIYRLATLPGPFMQEILSLDSDAPSLIIWMACGIGLTAAVRLLCSRTLLRIYLNTDTEMYTGVQMNWRFKKELFYFKRDRVRMKDTSKNVFGELLGNIQINNQPFFVSATDFKTAKHYNVMLNRRDTPI